MPPEILIASGAPGPVPGLYLLDLWLEREAILTPGHRGRQRFERGHHLYIGSAYGPGGLQARIRRHFRFGRKSKHHWHVDALLERANLLGAWWSTLDGQSECGWAESLGQFGRRSPDGFGSTDCGCSGHLVYFRSQARLEQAIGSLASDISGYLNYVQRQRS